MIKRLSGQLRFFSGLMVGVLLILIAGAVFLIIKHSNTNPVPASIQHQISFVTYLPKSDWRVSGISYQGGVLALTATQNGTRISLSEQTTPAVFSDVPQYYPALLSKLNQYASFGTINGSVYLTKPSELNGQQSAVLNNDGTLLFVRPSQALSNNQWQRFFNELRAFNQ